MSREVLLGELARLAEQIATARRRRPGDPPGVTATYIDLVFAVAQARLGAHAEATALVDSARAVLAVRARERHHPYLVGAFAARVEQARAGERRDSPLPTIRLASEDVDDGLTRYYIDRVLEHSQLLTRTPVRAPDPDVAAVVASSEPEVRAARLEELLERAEPARRPAVIEASLEAAHHLDEALAVPVLVRALAVLGDLPHVELHLAALELAARLRWAELLEVPLSGIRAWLPDSTPADRERIVVPALRVLRAFELRTELTELVTEVQAVLPDPADPIVFAVAGVRELLDDPRGRRRFADGHGRLRQQQPQAERLVLIRRMAVGYSLGSLELSSRELAGLADQLGSLSSTEWVGQLDLDVLHVTESLALAMADLAFAEAR